MENDVNINEIKQAPDAVAGKNAANLSLIFGIVSIVTSPVAIIGIIFAILGFAQNNKASRFGYTGGEKTGGIVCSIIGMILSILAIVLWLLVILGVISLFK
ncbi:MAG: hypothetical protein WC886_01835 [Saccharofermentanaceae bacterium]|jgi:uncharacterized membrane protein|nr:hypothetical protein [Clostridia bacterium]NLX68216.1 hypothetical protein [Clostridiaceae bacterium]HOO49112.1 hypothetical protein [Saccharofermentans sp.]HPE27391.1 hypothetical protein [Saccharofermentans sp.]HPG64750.1 hypothetical protein [Saccharofermentans sp.]